MKSIKYFGPLVASLMYDGCLKLWKVRGTNHEIVEIKDTVGCFIFNRDSREVLFVEQVRVPTLNSNMDSGGHLVEILAGHIDTEFESSMYPNSVDGALKAIAREAMEELGVSGISKEDIELLNHGIPLYLAPGTSTERMWLGYLEIGEGQFVRSENNFGLVSEGEKTERKWVALKDLPRRTFFDMKTYCLVQWFLRVKFPTLMFLKGE